MLQELFQPKPVNFENILENSKVIGSTFDSYLNFLKNPKIFPNPIINDSVTIAHDLIKKGVVKPTIHAFGDYFDVLHLKTIGTGKNQTHLLMFPIKYIEKINQNPISHLLTIADVSGKIADIKKGINSGIDYGALALQTLKEIAVKEGYELPQKFFLPTSH